MFRNFRTLFVLFFFSVTFRGFCSVNHWETPVFSDSLWRYFPGVSEPAANWFTVDFNDRAWSSGKGPFWYGKGIQYGTRLSGTPVSIYLRKSFVLADTSDIETAILSMGYDDGFVAFLNGVEIARSSGLTDAHPAYNTYSTNWHEDKIIQGLEERHTLSKETLAKILKNGTNVLAIQVHNKSGSSDLVAYAYLSLGIKSTRTYFTTTPDELLAEAQEAGTSNLPIIRINTNGSKSIPDEPKIEANFVLMDAGEGMRNSITDQPVLNLPIGIELRGQTSLDFATKKSYAFETRDELGENYSTEILGMPKENDWTLYGEYADNTMLRNTLAYYLGNKMGRWAPRTRHCELYLNGEYRGVYELIEKIKKDNNRVNIATLKSTDNAGDSLTGGYIFKLDKIDEEWVAGYDGFYSTYKVNKKSIPITYVYPKSKDITPQQKAYLQAFVKQFEDALYLNDASDLVQGYRNYIDVLSFVDYFLMNEFSKNVDGYRISSYFHKDKDSKEGKMVAGPFWDYNLAFGNSGVNYSEATNYSGWFFSFQIPSYDGSPIPNWWNFLYKDPYFQNQLKTRWTELRNSSFSYDSIASFLDEKAALITEAQKRDQAKWATSLEHGSYLGEITYIKAWIANRLAWMDKNMPGNIISSLEEKATEQVDVWPNPFYEQVNFRVASGENEAIRVTIFDLTGRTIAILRSTDSTAETTITWDGCNAAGQPVKDGAYLYRILVNDRLIKTGKLIKTGN